MNEQLIKALLQVYSEKGIQLSHIVSDPLFRILPLEEQIAAIKTNADKILAGSVPTTNSNTVKNALLRAGIISGITGATLLGTHGMQAAEPFKAMLPSQLPIKALLQTAGIAGAGSLAVSGVHEFLARKQKNQEYENFKALAKHTTDDNTLKFMVRSGFRPAITNAPANPIMLLINEYENKLGKLVERSKANVGLQSFENTFPDKYPEEYDGDRARDLAYHTLRNKYEQPI